MNKEILVVLLIIVVGVPVLLASSYQNIPIPGECDYQVLEKGDQTFEDFSELEEELSSDMVDVFDSRYHIRDPLMGDLEYTVCNEFRVPDIPKKWLP